MMKKEEGVGANGFVVPSQRELSSSPPPRERQNDQDHGQSPVLFITVTQT